MMGAFKLGVAESEKPNAYWARHVLHHACTVIYQLYLSALAMFATLHDGFSTRAPDSC